MSDPRPQACYFGPPGVECFGSLHLPGGDATRPGMGLVLCSPTGNEDQAAYRTLRQIALAAAKAGIPTLRFDYHGTGDSPGAEAVHDHPTSWRRSVDAAIDTLQAQSGVSRVCVVAVRLGTLPAAQATSERGDVCGFVALAPLLRGRGFLREALMRSLRPPESPTEGFELAGHTITAKARAQIAAIDLQAAALAPAPHVLVVSQGGVAEHARWQAHLRGQGVCVDAFEAPELTRMLEASVDVSQAVVRRVVEWVTDRAAQVRTAAVRSAASAQPLATSLELPGVIETPLNLGTPGADLFAILATPAAGRARRAVVLLNTGSARRIGASRMHVEWSRHWARAGVAVLRLDLPGLGDSAMQPGETEGDPYATETGAAIEAALALLRGRFGNVHCTLMGVCSGAYQAYQAALGGAKIQSLVLINQAAYRWLPGTDAEEPTTALRLSWRMQGGRAARTHSAAAFFSELKWQAIEGAFALFSWLRDGARWLGVPLAGDAGAALRLLARRGIALHVVQAEHDFSGPLLDLEANRTVATLKQSGELRVDRIAEADHIFTAHSSRELLRVALDKVVRVEPDRAAVGREPVPWRISQMGGLA